MEYLPFFRPTFGGYPNRYGRVPFNPYDIPKKESRVQNQQNSCKSPIRDENVKEKRNNDDAKRSEDMAFEIFGIKLFFDDILLIALIFFLYNEGVKDNMLFISLILLLLS